MRFSNTKILEENNLGTRRTWQQGGCIDLNGTNQAVRVADNTALDITDNLTVSVWAKNDASSLSSAEILIAKYDAAVNQRSYQFSLDPTLKLNLRLGDPADGTLKATWVSTNAIAINSINNYSFSFATGVLKFYLNGLEIAGAISSGAIPTSLYLSTTDLTVGSSLSSNVVIIPWDGQIFDARIYAGESTVLTAAQILSIYEDGPNNIQFAGQDLRAHYKLDEGSGITNYDSSGNENHGIIENAVSNWGVTQDIYSFQNQVGYNRRMYFDGVNDYVNLGNASLLNIGLSDFYVTGSFVADKIGPYVIIGKKNELVSSVNKGFVVYLETGGTFRANLTDGTSRITAISSTIIQIGVKYQFRVEWDRDANLTIYINGAQDGTTPSISSMSGVDITNSEPLKIGADFLSVFQGWNGSIFGIDINGASSNNGYGNTDSDWIDTSGNGNNGTVVGSPSNIYLPRDESDPTNDVLGSPLTYTGIRPNDAALINSSCLNLNGTNQAVRVDDNTDLDITDNLTVSVWAKNDASSLPGGPEVLIAKYDPTGNQRTYQIYLDSALNLNVTLGDPADGTVEGLWTSTNAVAINSTNNYSFSFATGAIKVYVNGLEIAGAISSGAIPTSLYLNTADLTIGSSLNSNAVSNAWDGQMFDARIYAGDSTVLTAAQILSIYEDGANNVEFAGQDLRARYVCAEGAGTMILDSSGNENHGTIKNAVSNWGVTQDVFHANLLNGHSRRMWFDAVDDLVSLGNTLDISDKTTVFRAKFTLIIDGPLTDFAYFFGKGLSPSVGGFTFRNGSTSDRGKLAIFIGDASISVNCISVENVFSSNGIYLIDAQWNGDRSASVSVNGSEVEMSTADLSQYNNIADMSNSEKLTIGGREFDSAGLVQGIISDIEFYINGILKYKTDGYGNTDADWIDTSGNGNNPTVAGSPEIIRIPASSATVGIDALGNDLQFPAGSKFIPAETEFNFNPDSTPEMGSTQLGFTVPAAHEFGDSMPSATKSFVRSETLYEDRFLFFKDALSATDLYLIKKYTNNL